MGPGLDAVYLSEKQSRASVDLSVRDSRSGGVCACAVATATPRICCHHNQASICECSVEFYDQLFFFSSVHLPSPQFSVQSAFTNPDTGFILALA